MGSFLLVLWDGGGNVSPFLGLAEGLRKRGHDVRAVATASLADRFSAAGIRMPVPSAGWLPTGAEVVEAGGSEGVDVVIVDYMATAGLNGARALGLPTVALVHTLYVDLLVDGAPSPMGMAGDVTQVNEERAQLGLPEVQRLGDLLAAVDLVMVTAPRELDGDGDGNLPSNVQHVGTLFPSAGADANWKPPAGDGPLVVASMGTAGHGQAPVQQRVLDAIAGLPVRGFVTIPSYVDTTELSVPDNVLVSGFVGHAAVMPHADVVVTHAGLGSVTAALAWGIPLVCMPEEREQPNNAAAVVRLGAGQALDRDADPDTIRAAINVALTSPRPNPMPPTGRALQLVEAVARGSLLTADETL